MSADFGGFKKQGQFQKYNQTVFELLMTLSARLNASLKLSKQPIVTFAETPETIAQNVTEVKVCQHI
jgi:hypothetical protein